jgi:hypothetical protein
MLSKNVYEQMFLKLLQQAAGSPQLNKTYMDSRYFLSFKGPGSLNTYIIKGIIISPEVESCEH